MPVVQMCLQRWVRRFFDRWGTPCSASTCSADPSKPSGQSCLEQNTQLKTVLCSYLRVILSICVRPVLGVTVGQQRRQTVRVHTWLTAVVSTFLFVHEKQICFLFARPLCHHCCFSQVHCSLAGPAAEQDNDFLVNEQRLEFVWVVFWWKLLWEIGVLLGQVGDCAGQVRRVESQKHADHMDVFRSKLHNETGETVKRVNICVICTQTGKG